ncbi:hypothetical protein QCA50_015124 [Cerrena zonata]|uniref:Fungal STAND N-terminal Goodbye domain-containing protein n=1 Tax=Cerrena zonata TaxID=2478898 RepID=A0AAW0FWT7_9APHY
MSLASSGSLMSPPSVRKKNPNAAAAGGKYVESHFAPYSDISFIVDRADQNNVQELLRTLSTCGDAKQKFLDIVHGDMEKTRFDFWKQANSLGRQLQIYSESLLDDAKRQVQEASGHIEEVRQIVHELITSANHLQTYMVSRLTNGVTTKSLSQAFEDALLPILEKVHEIAAAPGVALRLDHNERKRAVRELLKRIEEIIVIFGTKHGLDEAVLRKYLEPILALILKLVVLIGDLSEQHPILRNILIVTVIGMIIPESWVLRTILRIFGFGPGGPVKGSAAAWAQRYFYGASVKKGSWFAYLQRAGMKLVSAKL